MKLKQIFALRFCECDQKFVFYSEVGVISPGGNVRRYVMFTPQVN